jgi:hypothetical protein
MPENCACLRTVHASLFFCMFVYTARFYTCVYICVQRFPAPISWRHHAEAPFTWSAVGKRLFLTTSARCVACTIPCIRAALSVLSDSLLKRFSAVQCKGMRPSLADLQHTLHPVIIDVIRLAWTHNPRKRPHAHDIAQVNIPAKS